MIIEQDARAITLADAPFRLYGTAEEFLRLAAQAHQAARLVQIGWVEFDPARDTTAKAITQDVPAPELWAKKG